MQRKIKVGVDFDGVLAYNPFRVGRAIVAWVKTKVLRIKTLHFFVPQNASERIIWAILHESSVFPAKGTAKLKALAKSNTYEFYLVTARFGFLAPQVKRWLARWRLSGVFKALEINHAHQQPHVFKTQIVRKLELDYYIEDNWDIVQYLTGKTKTKIYWIYNVLDRGKVYQDKFPYLEKALLKIQKKS